MNKIALCFFGLNRSLSHTVASIEANVIAPLKEAGLEVDVVGALMRPRGTFSNARSQESDLVPEANFEDLLQPRRHEYIDQAAFDEHITPTILRLGLDDYYQDQHASTRNIVRELFSVKRSFSLLEGTRPDAVIFLRPDLLYRDRLDIARYLPQLEGAARVMTPSWQKWGGLNDRFALCNYAGAEVYGRRYDAFWHAAPLFRKNLQAEALLLATLLLQGVAFDAYTSEMAVRVRADGRHQDEAEGECGSNETMISMLQNYQRGIAQQAGAADNPPNTKGA